MDLEATVLRRRVLTEGQDTLISGGGFYGVGDRLVLFIPIVLTELTQRVESVD